jgi:DNA adenine methylase
LFRRYLGCWRRPRLFLEAFTGSGILGLTMLVEERIDRLLLVEKDPDYVAVWQTALGADAAWLIGQLLALAPTRVAMRAVMTREPTSRKELALRTLVESWGYHRGRRTKGFGFLPDESAHGSGASLKRAWKPQELALRIRVLHDLRRRITVYQGCGIQTITEHATRRDVFVYADPPYPTAGERMYVHSDVDLPALLAGCQQAQGPAVMSCEDHADVVQQAEALGLDCLKVHMHSATNQQMGELLISNRPLPHERPTTKGAGPEQLELGAE